MAKLTDNLYAVKPGEVYPENFAKGSECPKELETLARKLGILDEEPSKGKGDLPPLKNKVIKEKLSNKGGE